MHKRRHGLEFVDDFVDDIYVGVPPLRTVESAKPSGSIYIFERLVGRMPNYLADYAAF